MTADQSPPVARTPEREAVERALNDISKTLSRGNVRDDVWVAFERIRTRLWSEFDGMQPAREPARVFLEGPGAAVWMRLFTVEHQLRRVEALCLEGEDSLEMEVVNFAQEVRGVLGDLLTADGVLLTREEAALVARCARSFRGDRPRDIHDVPSLEPGTVYERLRLLAEKCEAAS